MPENQRSTAQEERRVGHGSHAGGRGKQTGDQDQRDGRPGARGGSGDGEPRGAREAGDSRAASRDERIGTLAATQELDTGDAGQPRGEAGDSRGGQKAPPERDRGEAAQDKRGGSEEPTVRRHAPTGGGTRDGGDHPSGQSGPGKTQVGQHNPEGRVQQRGRLSAPDAARAGMRGLADVISNEPVGVTEVTPRHDGWLVAVEVVELPRLPSSADILALYEAELDWDGRLRSYRRVKRYSRGRGEERE